jgi:hypothetical protein
MDHNWKTIKLRFQASHNDTDATAYASLPEIKFEEFMAWSDEQLGNMLRNIILRKLNKLPAPPKSAAETVAD